MSDNRREVFVNVNIGVKIGIGAHCSEGNVWRGESQTECLDPVYVF